jgi:PAS domain S-box-containing protein
METRTISAADSEQRNRAEEVLLRCGLSGTAEIESGLLHELRLGQIELQRQNDELRQERDAAVSALLQSARQITAARDDFEGFFSIGPELACIASTDGYFKKVNPAWQETLGYSEDDLLTTPFLEFIHPDDLPATLKEVEKQLAGETTSNFINRYRCRDGSYRWFDWRSTPARNGKIMYATARDITERKLAEEEREQYFKFFEASSDLMCIADPLGCFKKVNPACMHTLGYSEAELLSHPFIDFVHPDDRQTTVAEMTKQLERGFSLNFENRYLCKDGTVRWLSWRAVYSGEAGVTYATARDITERKHINAELAAARDAADAANCAKTQFLSNVSHEIRTPMNGIMGMAALLAYTDLSEEQAGYLDAIQSSATTLLTLINELLDLSKIEAGRMDLQPVKFSLRCCIADVLKSQFSLAQGKGLAVKTDIPAEIPDDLTGDQLRLKQILLNLVGNAIKFTERGSITVSVALGARRQDTADFHLMVTDTGIGIKSEAFERIFAPFSQSDASISRKYGGTGLGLSICTKLVALMNGRLRIESSEGVGSTFHVEIPFVVDQVPVQRRVGPGKEQPRWEGPLLHVLLVEDQEINRRYAMEILRRRGYLMEAAKDGVEAIKAWERGGVDLILMDVQMPVMDGIETTRAIRQRELEADAQSHVPIIALTAHALREDRANLLSLGFDGYVSKPIDIEMLTAEITRCLPERLLPVTVGHDA